MIYKVSVVIPAYNVDKYIKRCLDSVCNQTLKEIEIIVINDGSKDSTLDIIKEYRKLDSRINIIEQENLGQSVARNKGIHIAQGEYISFVDADDFIDSDYLEKLYHTAKNTNSDIACASIVRENNHKKKVLIEYKEIKTSSDIKEKCKIAKIPEHCYVCNKIYKRESLLQSKILFKEYSLYEDMFFTPQILANLGELSTVPDVYYHYWKNKKSTIKLDTETSRYDKLEANSFLIEFCKRNNLKRNCQILLFKKEIYILGIKILKLYQYQTSTKYYLFGLIPFIRTKKSV